MLTGAKMTCFESKAVTEMTHGLMEGDSHIRRTFLHPQSHVATVTTSLIPKDLDSYTSLQVNACDWEGTWKPSSPKFLAPQIFSTLMAKAHGCNSVTEGCVLYL